jgi:DNA invertase Pin-like site-specific DNA recombinase
MMSDQLTPAAEYVRMSTEDQKYSIDNQRAVIADYARSNQYEVVRTFADYGISGLDLKHRPGLKALLQAVASESDQFQVILVLDVSRWGRFQDIDESAFYEFLCRRAGLQVRYCAEPFSNDSAPFSNLLKAMKRTMAAEYSRELSTKVFRGQARLASMGFKQGGQPSIGMRRMLVDEYGKPKQLLAFGESKNLAKDRVILVPGPAAEVRFVRRIYRDFVSGKTIPAIAHKLREKGSFGRLWTPTSVRVLLQHPKYAGMCVYNRTTQRLRTPWKMLPRDKWITKEGAFEPVVPLELFNAVQEKMSSFTNRMTNEDFLLCLKKLLDEKGYLTQDLIAATPDIPCPTAYIRRFGGLMEAYRRIGFTGTLKVSVYSKLVAHLRYGAWAAIKDKLRSSGFRLRAASSVRYKIYVDGLPKFNFVMARPLRFTAPSPDGPQWDIRLPGSSQIESLIVAVLSSVKHEIIEYVVCPRIRKREEKRFRVTLPELIGMSVCHVRTLPELAEALKGLRGQNLRNQ